MSQSIRLVAGKNIACPVCGKTDGCMLMPHRDAVICIRVKDGCATRSDGSPITANKGMGWLHRLIPGTLIGKKIDNARRIGSANKLTTDECREIVKRHRSDLTNVKLEKLSSSLSVSVVALKEYGVGYDAVTGAYSFPMVDGFKKLCGIALRFEDGKKRVVVGSTPGLFIPRRLDLDFECHDGESPLLLAMPEGQTSACAAFDLGLRAIGRPSNMGGVLDLRNLLSRGKKKQNVVIVADHEGTKWMKDGTPHWPGWEGALDLADAILPAVDKLRVIKPPDKKKDLRKFLIDGGISEVLAELIQQSGYVDRQWIDDKLAQVNEYKVKLKRAA